MIAGVTGWELWLAILFAGIGFGYFLVRTRTRSNQEGSSRKPSTAETSDISVSTGSPQDTEYTRQARRDSATITTLSTRIKELGYMLAETRAKYQSSHAKELELTQQIHALQKELDDRLQAVVLDREERLRRILELEAELEALRRVRTEHPPDKTSGKKKTQRTLPPKQKHPSYQISTSDDDLKEIRGIGPVFERILHERGIRSFKQIAEWTSADIVDMVQRVPEFKGRIERERWIDEARKLYEKKYEATISPQVNRDHSKPETI